MRRIDNTPGAQEDIRLGALKGGRASINKYG
jgi:hypothetical protein